MSRTRVKSNFSPAQIYESSEDAMAYECPHVEPELQAAAKADPDMGGLLCMTCATLRMTGHMIEQLLDRFKSELLCEGCWHYSHEGVCLVEYDPGWTGALVPCTCNGQPWPTQTR